LGEIAAGMSDSKRAPEVPEVIVDEAGVSARWVPQVGIALFTIAAIVVVLRIFATEPFAPPADPAAAAPAAAAKPND
jgi:hypothetical protein